MGSEIWRLFKVSCKDIAKYGYDVLLISLVSILLTPLTSSYITWGMAMSACVIVIVCVILLVMYIERELIN
jgi:uncharacterized membrane protein (DUF485 family)